MTYATGRARASRWPTPYFGDAYLRFGCFALLGYAVLGKGFAYLGVPPLFVGEILLLLGFVGWTRTRCVLATFVPVQNQILAGLMVLIVIRAAPDIGIYGLDTIRDSMLVFYGLFAFFVTALLLEQPHRIEVLVARYASFAWLYGLIGGPLFLLAKYTNDAVPKWPWSGTPMFEIRPGEASVHVAGATIFVLLGLRKVSLPWVLALLFGLALLTPSRGGMLACLVPSLLAAVVGRQMRKIVRIMLLCLVFFGLMAVLGIKQIGPPNPDGSHREIGLEQIVDNVNSILGESKSANLDDTKTWRLHWWQRIKDYTLHGPYFWTGKGLGINLSVVDGISNARSDNPLRSPHNVNMTFLARTGVPGVSLWILLLATWFGRLLWDVVQARRRGDIDQSNVLLWIVAYGLAFVIDASFDVALEGPMLGIWFWCLFGLGIAASMIYRMPYERPAPGSARRSFAFDALSGAAK
ncbi:O-antigen ligase family protein [Methylobacterium sp. WL30]|uniref:O-antigen ligase family protein n=1 Tax=unclassified Methylobacterium TaxID=2615210 RepID=UPI0011CB8E74|nr:MULTISPECIES: O-antigen ligase family protein [unclassified Methylobacterium]TXN36563.1 O-antigen ligase family protein [Methylobacterium sp. WL93]TXN47863.1 O-antigen ligase family protein [Methylobacterium sp. WL119]TXN65039.1 O-antigen ligase family protein [Methylobacterium sp. WL30]